MKTLPQLLHQAAPIPVVFGMSYIMGAAHIVAQNGVGGNNIRVADWIAGFAIGALLTCLGVRLMPSAFNNSTPPQPCKTEPSAS